MMVPLTQLQVTGLRPRLDDALDTLQRLQVAEVVAVVEPGGPPGDLAELIARLDTLRALVGDHASFEHTPSSHGASGRAVLADEALREVLDHLEPRVAELLAELEGLRNEAQSLPRSIDALDALQPLVPELGRLDDRQLASLGLVSIALVLDDPDERVVSELTRQLADLLGRGHLMATSAASPGGPVGCLLVLRRRDLARGQRAPRAPSALSRSASPRRTPAGPCARPSRRCARGCNRCLRSGLACSASWTRRWFR